MRYLRFPRGLSVFGPILVVLALLLLGSAAWAFRNQRTRLRIWPGVEAEVIRSYVVTRKLPGNSRMFFAAQHELRFTVGDREYVAVTDSGDPSPVFAEAQARVDEFHSGSRHLVHYNPQDPTDVRIELASAMRPFMVSLLLAGIGSVFLLFGMALSWGVLYRAFRGLTSRLRPVLQGNAKQL